MSFGYGTKEIDVTSTMNGAGAIIFGCHWIKRSFIESELLISPYTPFQSLSGTVSARHFFRCVSLQPCVASTMRCSSTMDASYDAIVFNCCALNGYSAIVVYFHCIWILYNVLELRPSIASNTLFLFYCKLFSDQTNHSSSLFFLSLL